jgi:hypothetical protein
VDIRREAIRFIQRPDANEPNRVAATGVVTPQGDVAVRTTGDLLSFAAERGCIDNFDLTPEQLHPFGFDQRIQRIGGASLTLAPTAMTTMNE